MFKNKKYHGLEIKFNTEILQECLKTEISLLFGIPADMITEAQRAKEFCWKRNVLTCYITTIPIPVNTKALNCLLQGFNFVLQNCDIRIEWYLYSI